MVNYHSYIGFVDTHTKGVGGYYYSCQVALPGFLFCRSLFGSESCMVEISADTILIEIGGYLLGALAIAYIHDGTARHSIQDMHDLVGFLIGLANNIADILASEAFA